MFLFVNNMKANELTENWLNMLLDLQLAAGIPLVTR